MSEDLRQRFKSSKKSGKSTPLDSGSIFGIWAEQNRMQAEEEKMARELAETKKKAKELSKTLRKHRYGEVKEESLQKIKHYKSSVIKHAAKTSKAIKKRALLKKKLSIGITFFAVGIIGYLAFAQFNPNTSATLGESKDNPNPLVNPDLLPVEKPKFSILVPAGATQEDLDIKRTNPPESATSYTFIDSLEGSEVLFQVTQQEVPANFNLQKTATDFQATNIIQIDDNKIYHGFSDKAKIQSLIFVKNRKLVLISSPQKLSDDQWVGYITGLR